MAKLLPNRTYLGVKTGDLIWSMGVPVRDIEFLHLCWLVEETLFRNTADWAGYRNMIIQTVANTSHNTFPSVYLHASWQQRVVALAEVKGIEIIS